MSSLDMSVEYHDHYNPDAEGIPTFCWCHCQPVLEMHREGKDVGRMVFRCTNKDAAKGGYLFRWFDTAVHYEFIKFRGQIHQIRRLTEFNESETSRVAEGDIGASNPRLALLEEAHDQLKEEVRMLKAKVARERRRLMLMLVCLGVSLNYDGNRRDVPASSS